MVRDEGKSYVSLLSGGVEVNGPFVEAKLARKNIESGAMFVPAMMPASVTLGIFNLTTSEAKQLGFRPTGQEFRDREAPAT